MYVEPVETNYEVDEAVDHCLGTGRPFQSPEERQSKPLEGSHVELKQLLEAGPEEDADLTKVTIQGGATPLRQDLLVLFVDSQH